MVTKISTKTIMRKKKESEKKTESRITFYFYSSVSIFLTYFRYFCKKSAYEF